METKSKKIVDDYFNKNYLELKKSMKKIKVGYNTNDEFDDVFSYVIEYIYRNDKNIKKFAEYIKSNEFEKVFNQIMCNSIKGDYSEFNRLFSMEQTHFNKKVDEVEYASKIEDNKIIINKINNKYKKNRNNNYFVYNSENLINDDKILKVNDFDKYLLSDGNVNYDLMYSKYFSIYEKNTENLKVYNTYIMYFNYKLKNLKKSKKDISEKFKISSNKLYKIISKVESVVFFS